MYGLWVCLNECRPWSFVFVSSRTGKTLAFKHPFRVYNVRYTILIPRPVGFITVEILAKHV